MNNGVRGIVIDPGHGGSDPGALGNGLREKDYSLMISRYMANRFNELGIPVVLTRDDDITLSPTERVNKVLNAFGNNPNVIVVSNHLNAGGGDGAEVIYALRNDATLPNRILNNLELAGQNVRKVYQRRLPSNPSKDYYFMHRNTGDTQSVIVEYGFIDSTGDDANQIKNNWERYAEAVVKAIAEYIGANYYPENNNNYYVVKAGDTLYSIAQNNNVSVSEIKSLNDLKDNTLSIGQILFLPTFSNNENTNINRYIVRKGDSLYSIALNNNTTINEIKRLNNLTSNILSVGQELLLSGSNISTDPNEDNVYIVKSGDSLYSIALNNNISVDELKRINNLSSNIINIGQQLLLSDSNNNDNESYVVKAGDTLYSIAQKNNTTVDEIKRLNNIVGNILSIGQEIILPYYFSNVADPFLDDMYTVLSGDTLYSIARRFNISVDELKRINNLENNLLKLGQVLKIK